MKKQNFSGDTVSTEQPSTEGSFINSDTELLQIQPTLLRVEFPFEQIPKQIDTHINMENHEDFTRMKLTLTFSMETKFTPKKVINSFTKCTWDIPEQETVVKTNEVDTTISAKDLFESYKFQPSVENSVLNCCGQSYSSKQKTESDKCVKSNESFLVGGVLNMPNSPSEMLRIIKSSGFLGNVLII